MRDRSYQDSVDFLARFFGGVTEHAVELRSFTNEPEDNSGRPLFGRDMELVGAHCRRWDMEGRGMFFGTCTRLPGVSKGTRQHLSECRALWVDIDCMKHGIDTADAISVLRSLPFPPSIIIGSGGGIHAYWLLSEAIDVSVGNGPVPTEAEEEIVAALKQLAGVLAGDTKVCDLARVMRLPGTHNTKSEVIEAAGAPVLVAVLEASWATYEFSDLVEWLDYQRPMLKAPDAVQGDPEDPYMAASKRMGFKPPVDVEAALREMTYGGHGDTAVHQTQLRVSASLITQGVDVDEVVATLLEATRAAAGDAGRAWNWKREEAAIRRMCTDAKAKFGARENSQVVNLAEQRQKREEAKANGTTGTVAPTSRSSAKKGSIAAIGDATIEYWQTERGPLISVAGELATYADGFWTIFGEPEAHALRVAIQGVTEAQEADPKTSTLNAVWRYIVERPALMREAIDWNASGLVVCRNGAIDPTNGVMHSHSPEHYATFRIEADINITADCPIWLEFLNGCLSNLPADERQAVIDTLQEWFGASLVRGKSREMTKALLAYGPSRSGKTQLAQVHRALVGGRPSGMRARDLEDKFGMQPLIGASAWIADDAVSSGDYLDAERFKVIVTGEPVSIPRKNMTNWEGWLDMPVLLTSNHLPRVRDQSDAVYNRSLILPMTVVRTEADSDVVPISERIIASDLGGILNWSIAGWKRLRYRGRFVPPAPMLKAVESYKTDNNPVGAWLAEAVKADEWTMVDRRDVRASFLGWYTQEFGESEKVPGGRWLFPSIRQQLPHITDHKSNSQMYVVGLRLTDVGLAYLKHAQNTAGYGRTAGSGDEGASVNRTAPTTKQDLKPTGKQPRF